MDIFRFLIFLSTWEWTNMPSLGGCLFIVIATIPNKDKYCPEISKNMVKT